MDGKKRDYDIGTPCEIVWKSPCGKYVEQVTTSGKSIKGHISLLRQPSKKIMDRADYIKKTEGEYDFIDSFLGVQRRTSDGMIVKV